MRWSVWGGLLIAGTVTLVPGDPPMPEAAAQAQKADGWLVWWAEGQKAARETGKPIFLVFR